MLPGKTFTLDEIVRIIRRRWLLILLPLVVGAAAGGLAFRRFPLRYQSETVILVVPQRVPESFVKGTDALSVQDRLRSLGEQIQTRARLTKIIKDFGLYGQRSSDEVSDSVIQRMRADIDVKFLGNELSFRLAYIHPDPHIAQRVTEGLADLYIAENVRDRASVSEETSIFLDSELQKAKQRLVEQEKKLEAYRRRYAGQLPSQLDGNLQAIQNTQGQLRSVSDSMNRARERRLLIERQIADVQGAVVDPPALRPESTSPGTAVQQLEVAKARLAELQTRYTANHPDVQAAEQTVRELQSKADEETQLAADSPAPLSPFELARARRLNDLQAEQAIIDAQLEAAEAEEVRLKGAIADYQGKVEGVPARESELTELTRDYSTIQQAYASLLQRREDSRVAANMEQRQIAEQFKVLDPASLPERPYNQRQRLGVLVGGPASGLVAGLLLVGFLERQDSSFKREEDVMRVLSLPVLALIPVMDDSSRVTGRIAAVLGRLGSTPAGTARNSQS